MHRGKTNLVLKNLLNATPGDKFPYKHILSVYPEFEGRKTTHQWVKCPYCNYERLVTPRPQGNSSRACKECFRENQKKTWKVGSAHATL